jgi:phosphopantothenoylcysteine decarboxylase/phosphopantothenate--cysteine ligase
LLVAFAAETQDAVEHARVKLAQKNADLIVVNEVGIGKVFGTDDNTVIVLYPDGTQHDIASAPKIEIADAVWDLVPPLW